MLPTAIVAMPLSFRMRSENGVWNMRPYTGRARVEVCPAETSTMSTSASRSRRAIWTASSGVVPSSPTQSLAEIRIEIGFSGGQTSRTAW